jgi:hypothetical protein
MSLTVLETMSQSAPDRRLAKRAERLLIAISGMSSPAGAVFGNVMPLFALRIGASVGTLGVLYALLWVTDIMQFLAAPRLRRVSKQRWMLAWYALSALSFSTIFLIPLLPQRPSLSTWFMLAVVGIYNLLLSTGLAAVSPYVRQMVPLEETGSYLGRTVAVISSGTLVSALLMGVALGSSPAMWRFYALFAVGNLALYLRILLAMRLPHDRADIGAPIVQGTGLLAPLRDRDSRAYAWVVMAATAVGALPAPLFAPYFSQALGLPDSLVVVVRTSTMVAAILLGTAIGRAADRFGFRLPLAAGLAASGLSSLVLVWLGRGMGTPALALAGALALAASGAGVTTVSTALGRERFVRARAPFEAEFLGLTSAAIGVGAALASIAGGLLPSLWHVLGLLPAGITLTAYRYSFAALAAVSLLAAMAAGIHRKGAEDAEVIISS